MATCAGCGVEFDDSVELYPRLVITKEVQVAKRLAEKEGEEEMLCLGCWLEAVDRLDKRQLAMLILGMLRKVNTLEDELAKRWKYPDNHGVIEKIRDWGPPYTSPNSGAIWVAPQEAQYSKPYMGDPPPNHGNYTISSDRHTFEGYRVCSRAQSQKDYICGTWSNKVQ